MSNTFSLETAHQLRPFPSYLVVLDGPKKKGSPHFVAIKLDETTHFIKCAGFFTNADTESIAKNYSKMIEETPIERIVEVLIPWSKVAYVQSLIYRHKAK